MPGQNCTPVYTVNFGDLPAGLYTLKLQGAAKPPGDGYHWVDYLELTSTPKLVKINVHPGSDPNPINSGSGGSTPVAIFGSIDFDVYAVNQDELKLGDAKVKVAGKSGREMCSIKDIGSFDPEYTDSLNPTPDGYYDLVCHFVTADIDLAIGEDLPIKILGELTPDAYAFEGTDVVKVVQ